MSEDNRTEVIVNSFTKGACHFLFKRGVIVDNFKYLWQYVVLHIKKIYDQVILQLCYVLY